MSSENQATSTVVSEFVPLISQESHSFVTKSFCRKNIIKAHEVTLSGAVVVAYVGASPIEPTVLVHREGNTVTGIEFCCVCGNSAAVQLDYGGE
jgi:hypothetical protein